MKTYIVAILISLFCAAAFAQLTLWECHSCRQQYQGNSPPYFTKCPSTNFKYNHLWRRKN